MYHAWTDHQLDLGDDDRRIEFNDIQDFILELVKI